MTTAPDMAERHSAILAELAELGLALARDLQARALEAETPEAAGELGLAFQRISRSVRQSLALEAKLVRDRERAFLESRAAKARADAARVTARKAVIRDRLEIEIWDEAEGDEAERLLDLLDVHLEDDDVTAAFVEHAVETHIARLRAILRLPDPDRHAPNGPAPPARAPGNLAAMDAGQWRSSA